MRIDSGAATINLPAPYEVIALLHAGGERSVARVHDRDGGGTRVLKIVNPGAGPEAIRAIGQEFLLLERIAHPHLVRVSRFLHLSDGSCGFLMEDLPFGIAAGPESPGWMPRDPEAVRSILGALRCLHAIGYAHLDLKPSQVLNGPRGATLIDLGLAAPISSPIVARGTWGFIAPEILKGEGWDKRVDLYELGCLLVAVWTGEAVFGRGDIAEQIRRQMKRPRLHLRDHVAGIPEGLDRAVEALLDPDPAERPADAEKAWESIHTMAGARERYLERRSLPVPEYMPLMVAEETEEGWDKSLREGQPDTWSIDGPAGSGRRRMMRRLRARAEVLGAECTIAGDRLEAVMPARPGAAALRVTCRLGTPRAGEHGIVLGAVGPAQARAALDAYGLSPEGGEEGWTAALLQARLEERIAGVEARRRSGRTRRALAAALGAHLSSADRGRLAEAIAAVLEEERPAAIQGELLLRDGYLREGAEGRLRPATPPWDLESLQVLVEEEEIVAAHRGLLARPCNDPVAAVQHALGARDAPAVARLLDAGVAALRARGDVTRALDLLTRARVFLGPAFSTAWCALQAALALEDGAPALCLPLLESADPTTLPAEWRVLLRAQLAHRGGRRQEAIDAATPLLDERRPASVRRAAGAIVVRALAAGGELVEACRVGLPLLDEQRSDDPGPGRLRLAALLFNTLTLQGNTGEETSKVRRILEGGLAGVALRERLASADALGGEAFRRGEFTRARELFASAYEAALAIGDPMLIAGARTNLGGVQLEAGHLAESEDLNRLALAGYEALQERVHAAVTRRNLATVLCQAGRWREALDLARASREELEALGAQDEADSVLGLEAGLLIDLGLFAAARQALDLCAGRLQRIPQPIVEAILERDLGRLERAAGARDGARRAWGLSIAVAESAEASDEEARTLQEWTAAEIAWGNPVAAGELRERAVKGLGGLETGEPRARREFLDAALQCCSASKDGIAEARHGLATAAAIAAECGLRPWTWRCHAAHAGVEARLGDDAAARTATRAALDALRDLLAAIGAPALQESYVLLPDPRLFLAWCEHEDLAAIEIAPGSSDLEVFLR